MTPAELTPAHIGGYRVERVLATGGMGAVYLVQSPTLPRREALKVLSADLAGDPRMRTRFTQEADITAGLDHPNIVRVHSRGDTDGQLWIAMEFVDGTDAETALRAGAIPPQRALHIITEVARALDYAHRNRVVHQDIKPSNFLLGARPGEQERVVLSDFGAALTPESADLSGGPMTATLAYAAPEVIAGKTVDGRADVYSLGCTLFRLLTGRYPFPHHDDVSATINAHLDQAPRRISDYLSWAGPQLDDVIAKALAKDPAQRYTTAGELAGAARRALDAAAAAPTPRTPPSAAQTSSGSATSGAAVVDFIGHLPRTQPVASKRRILAAAGIAAALVAVGLVAWLALPAREPTHNPTSSTPSAITDPAAAATLAAALPTGYPAGSCTSAGINADLAAAAVTCGPAPDTGGPPTATYTLARNHTALQSLFAQQTAAATTVVCPGNVQSPGPWHRVANPTVPVGMVFCGLAHGRPLVAWTTDDKLLMSTIEAQASDSPTLDQLYTWWASHS
ncbi:serine/threonine-protein kinase [Mycolicibacterium chlorophenolicum]|uniref:non-specific serine/threonine protein kinase n=1 Tax=Mycolicibacterium chlorophenolicum TaxID=37916 RepID=A0A0J6VBD8_9MYCO|nr:serine/threonine-protein kinase [Mycolicibacterium chlorophenolicum]KMO67032.1 Serine/threonine-protein kinase PknJ [Mycolicibacterium chlorophenolicum]